MTKDAFLWRILGVLALFMIVILFYELALRGWHLRWGTADIEAYRVFPGDEIIPNPNIESTRAITINASATKVWPWLVQMGQGRAGFYSYDWLENLIGCDIHSESRVVPEFQNLKVGDEIRLGPDGYPFYTVAEILPGKSLVLLGGKDVETGINTWVFVIDSLGQDSSRLIVRTRYSYVLKAANILMWRVLTEIAHFVMERKMMIGIKQRAEGTQKSQAYDFIQVLLWMMTSLALFIAFISILIRKLWWRPLAVATLSMAVLIFQLFRQPPVLFGVILDIGIITALIWAFSCASKGD